MMDILSRLKHLISRIMPRTILLNAYIWKMIPLFLNIMFPLCLLLNGECQADLKASLEHGHHIVLLHWIANNEIFNFQQSNKRIEDNLRYDAERTCLLMPIALNYMKPLDETYSLNFRKFEQNSYLLPNVLDINRWWA